MLEDISGSQIKDQFKSNKNLRLTTFAVGGVLLAVIGYFAYVQFMFKPANEESKDKYYVGLNFAVADSTDAALDELRVHKDKYDGKIGGEVSQFVYARQLMENGEFKKAIEELDGVDVNDTYVRVMTVGLKADCYSEMEKYKEATELYIEAADLDDNDLTAPMYLMKAALNAEEIQDYKTATTCYERIRDDYSNFANLKSIDKYIAKTKNKIVE